MDVSVTEELFNAVFICGIWLWSSELKLNGKKFPWFHFFFFPPKHLGNTGEFLDYLQTSWPTSQIPDIFQTCRHHYISTYKGCPIISETALCTDREHDLSANHGTTRFPQAITDTTSHQWSLYVQMWRDTAVCVNRIKVSLQKCEDE